MAVYIDATADKVKYFYDVWTRLGYKNQKTLLDVGAGESPISFATHIIDYIAYEDRGNTQGFKPLVERFTKETWNQTDFYIMPWAYEDKFFDFINCNQTLEDIRDPIAICKEMMRVGKAGFIECPNIISELSENFFHHRWFVRVYEERLQFLHKSPEIAVSLENRNDLKKLVKQRTHSNRTTTLEWKDSFVAEEIYCKNEGEYVKVLDEWIQHDLQLHGRLQK